MIKKEAKFLPGTLDASTFLPANMLRSPKWSPSNFYVFRLCRHLVQACSWTWVGYDLLQGLRKEESDERVCEFVFLEWRLYTFDFLLIAGV